MSGKRDGGRTDDRIEAALAEVWARQLPLIQQRIAAVERAAAEMAKPVPTPDLVDLGKAEAHKLAGVLGTFGLTRATELARDLEQRLGSERVGEAGKPVRIAAELRSLVEGARVGEDQAPKGL